MNLKKLPAAIFSLIALIATTDSAIAFYLTPKQVLRFQPSLLRNEQPFSVKGALTIDQKKYSTLLSWSAPLKYSLTIEGIAGTAYAQDNGPDSWAIVRDSKGCFLKTETKAYACSSPSFWALLELGGSGETLVRALRSNKFILDEDMSAADVDVTKLIATPVKERRSQLALGFNGTSPVAVIEIKGENFHEEANASYPLLQFEQKFLTPLLARNLFEGDLITWKSTANLEIRREQPRFRPVLASKLEIIINNNSFATFTRQPEGPASKISYSIPAREAADISALQSTLSEEGRKILRALFLTH